MTKTAPAIILKELVLIIKPLLDAFMLDEGEPLSLIFVPDDLNTDEQADIAGTMIEALDVPERVLILLAQSGIHLDPDDTIKQTITGIKDAIPQQTLNAIAQFADGDTNIPIQQLGAISNELKDVFQALQALRNILPTDGDFDPGIPPGAVLPALMQHLVVRHFRDNRSVLFDIFAILGVIDTAALESQQRGQLRLDKLGPALGDPFGAIRETFVLDVPEAELEPLLEHITSLAQALTIPAEMIPAPDHSLAGHDPDADGADQLAAVRIPVVSVNDPVLMLQCMFIELLADTDGARGVFTLAASGEFGQEIRVDAWRLAGLLEGELSPDIGLVLSASGLSPALTSDAASGAALTLTLARDADISVLEGPLNVTLGAPEVMARMRIGAESGWRVEGKIHGSRIALSPDGLDGFLAKIVPSKLELKLDTTVGVDSADGFFLSPGAGLDVDIPARLDFGDALKLDGFQVSLKPSAGDITVVAATQIASKIGPVSASLDGLGATMTLTFPEDMGASLDRDGLGKLLDVSIALPTGFGMSVQSGPVKGGGFLKRFPDEGRYAGGLTLDIPPLGLTAFGLLDTQMPDGAPGFSMLLFVTGRFAPIPLGFGFNLTAVGGLMGLHRDVNTESLFTAVKTGAAKRLLSPEDPVSDSAQLIRDAQMIFPVKRGQHVFGPTVQMTWGTPKPLIFMDLALALTLPEPLRLILIAAIKTDLPDKRAPLVSLRIDVAGILDLTNQTFEMRGHLYDSRIQGIPVSGGFAIQSSWGDTPSLAFAAGGLHPAFRAPPGFPAVDRIAIDLSKNADFKLRIEGYLAITSNSFQMGADLDLAVRAAGFGVFADLGFDTLLVLTPFALTVAIRAGATVKKGNRSICTVRLKGQLAGPGPWRASGSARIEVLFFDVDVAFNTTFGAVSDGAVDSVRLWQDHVQPALSSPEAFSGDTSDTRGLVLDNIGDRLLPWSALHVTQKIAPLSEDLDQAGGRSIIGPKRIEITGLQLNDATVLPVAEAVTEPFAPAQFFEMSEAERLSADAFSPMTAGATFTASTGQATGPSLIADISPETLLIDLPEPARQQSGETKPPLRLVKTNNARASVFQVGGDLRASGGARTTQGVPQYSLRPEGWHAADTDLQPQQARTSWAKARHAKVVARAGEMA